MFAYFPHKIENIGKYADIDARRALKIQPGKLNVNTSFLHNIPKPKNLKLDGFISCRIDIPIKNTNKYFRLEHRMYCEADYIISIQQRLPDMWQREVYFPFEYHYFFSNELPEWTHESKVWWNFRCKFHRI